MVRTVLSLLLYLAVIEVAAPTHTDSSGNDITVELNGSNGPSSLQHSTLIPFPTPDSDAFTNQPIDFSRDRIFATPWPRLAGSPKQTDREGRRHVGVANLSPPTDVDDVTTTVLADQSIGRPFDVASNNQSPRSRLRQLLPNQIKLAETFRYTTSPSISAGIDNEVDVTTTTWIPTLRRLTPVDRGRTHVPPLRRLPPVHGSTHKKLLATRRRQQPQTPLTLPPIIEIPNVGVDIVPDARPPSGGIVGYRPQGRAVQRNNQLPMYRRNHTGGSSNVFNQGSYYKPKDIVSQRSGRITVDPRLSYTRKPWPQRSTAYYWPASIGGNSVDVTQWQSQRTRSYQQFFTTIQPVKPDLYYPTVAPVQHKENGGQWQNGVWNNGYQSNRGGNEWPRPPESERSDSNGYPLPPPSNTYGNGQSYQQVKPQSYLPPIPTVFRQPLPVPENNFATHPGPYMPAFQPPVYHQIPTTSSPFVTLQPGPPGYYSAFTSNPRQQLITNAPRINNGQNENLGPNFYNSGRTDPYLKYRTVLTIPPGGYGHRTATQPPLFRTTQRPRQVVRPTGQNSYGTFATNPPPNGFIGWPFTDQPTRQTTAAPFHGQHQTRPSQRGYGQQSTVKPLVEPGLDPQGGYGFPIVATLSPNGYGGINVLPTLRPSIIDPSAISCYLKYVNCLLVNIPPLIRLYRVTEEACLRRCLDWPNQVCQAAGHNPWTGTCELFDNGATKPPARPVTYLYWNYYTPNGRCPTGGLTTSSERPVVVTTTTDRPTPSPRPITTSPTPFTSPPPLPPIEDTCAEGTSAVFQRAEGWELIGSDGFVTTGVSESACAEACRINQTPNGTPYKCLSVDYDASKQQCILSSEAAAPIRQGVLQENPDSVYLEKICIEDTFAVQCQGLDIDRLPQKVLIGFGETVEMAGSLKDCLELCLASTDLFGFRCRSIMYFYEEAQHNCLINTESRRTMPQAFETDEENLVEYLGIDDCLRAGVINAVDTSALRVNGDGKLKLTRLIPRIPVTARNMSAVRGTKTAVTNRHRTTIRLFTTTTATTTTTVAKTGLDIMPVRLFSRNGLLKRYKLLKKLKESRMKIRPAKPAPVTTPSPTTFKPLTEASPFEIRRMINAKATRKKNVAKKAKTKDQPSRARKLIRLVLGRWLEWSDCDRRHTGRRIRYRYCNAPVLRQCPFQTQWCNKEGGKGAKHAMVIPENAFLPRNGQVVVEFLPAERQQLLNNNAVVEITSGGNSQQRKATLRKVTFVGRCLPYNGSCRIGIMFLNTGKRRFCRPIDSKQCRKLNARRRRTRKRYKAGKWFA